MAASATFALKAGLRFRRGRLVIVSPATTVQFKMSGHGTRC
jgi:hypothetical protein